MMLIQEIAKIDRADVEIEDHGILTLSLFFSGGSWGQGAPAYNLNGDHCGQYIRELLGAVGVRSVAALAGRTVFVLREEGFGPIVGIENLPTENGHRLIFSEFWESMKAEAK